MFETPLAPIYGNAVGIRMLVAFLVVAIGLFFALRLLAGAAGLQGTPVANLGFVVALLAAFVVAQRTFGRMPMAAVGVGRFADWELGQPLYFLRWFPWSRWCLPLCFTGSCSPCWNCTALPGFCCSRSSPAS